MDFSLLRVESHLAGQRELQPTSSPAIRRLMFRRLRRKAVADGLGCHSPTCVGCCSGNARGIEVALSGGPVWGPPAAFWRLWRGFCRGRLEQKDRLCTCHIPLSGYIGPKPNPHWLCTFPPFRSRTEILWISSGEVFCSPNGFAMSPRRCAHFRGGFGAFRHARSALHQKEAQHAKQSSRWFQ